MNRLQVGVLYSSETKMAPYLEFAEYWIPFYLGVPVNVKLINCRAEEIDENLDLLILVGGADVDSTRYASKPDTKAGKPNLNLEWFDKNILPQYIEETKKGRLKILGICRGLQTLVVHFGGELSQHIYVPYSGDDRGKLVENLVWTNSKNGGFVEKVNSLHHQGAYPSQVVDFDVIATAGSKDGNVEIIQHKELPILAFQFHPEEIILEGRVLKSLQNLFA